MDEPGPRTGPARPLHHGPNPWCVGAVLVKAGVVVGGAGTSGPVSPMPRSMPCTRQGRGPRCHRLCDPGALLPSRSHAAPRRGAHQGQGVTRVVAAMVDPNPQVGGRGLRMLSEAGIKTDFGLLAAEPRPSIPVSSSGCAPRFRW